MKYPCNVRLEVNVWIGSCPDIPHIFVEAETPEEVVSSCRALIGVHIKRLTKKNQPFPQPSDCRLGQRMVDVSEFLFTI